MASEAKARPPHPRTSTRPPHPSPSSPCPYRMRRPPFPHSVGTVHQDEETVPYTITPFDCQTSSGRGDHSVFGWQNSLGAGEEQMRGGDACVTRVWCDRPHLPG